MSALSILRTLLILALLLFFVVCGATVKLGDRTFFQHVARIWQSDETQDMVKGIEKKSGPVVDRVKRGVKKGLEEATKDLDAGADAR